MGLTQSVPAVDTLNDRSEKKYRLSCLINDYISKKISNPPVKLKLIAVYHSLYEKLFGPWGRVVGSFADSLSLASSDVDIILEGIEVFSSPSEIPNNGKIHLVIHTEDSDIPPGCCWLRIYRKDLFGVVSPATSETFQFLIRCGFTKRIRNSEWKMVNIKGSTLLSSKDVSEHRQQEGLTTFPFLNYILPRWLPHGPAFRQTYFAMFDVDILEAFSCKKIPRELQRWVKRNRKQWPSPKTIDKALKQGCHVIALPSKITSDEFGEIEFRFGYGGMEKVLMDSLSDCQKHCYMLLKIILKEYIEPNSPEEDIISSYMMKNIIFWMAEETDADMWEPKNLLDCLQLCLKRLHDWVEIGNCPNYFIPEYNLLRTKERQMLSNFRIWFRQSVDVEWDILLKCHSMKFLCTNMNI